MNFKPFELSDKQFDNFRSLIYEKCGINLNAGKKQLVLTRLSKRLRKIGFDDFNSYYNFLTQNDSGEEMIEMINSISTNLTHFFREQKHFEFLESKALPQFFESIATKPKPVLRIWSAGCSTGEEPYSIAIFVSEFMQKTQQIDLKILATDISTKVLNSAQNGIYHQAKLDSMPKDLLRRYFQKGEKKWQGYYRVKSSLRNMIQFKRLNLIEPFSFEEKFDLIFCRNVMIYFDRNVQETLINKFYNAMTLGGYLLVGHAESLMSLNHPYSYIQPAVYFKNEKTSKLG